MLTQLEKKNKFLIIVAKLHACKIGHYLHNWSMPHLPVFWTVRTKTFATDREEVKSRKREKKVKEEEAGQKRLRLNFAYVHALNSKILFIAEISKNSRLSAKYCIPRKISKVKNHLKVKCSTSLERWSYVKGLKQLLLLHCIIAPKVFLDSDILNCFSDVSSVHLVLNKLSELNGP